MSTVFDCSLYQLEKNHEERGNLIYVCNSTHVSFDVKRVFYSYDIPGGEARRAHAHKECHQFLIATSDSFEVVLDDGVNKCMVLLDRPFCGLHVLPGIWVTGQGFSSGSIYLVLASEGHLGDDYIRSYEGFIRYREGL